MRAAQQRKRFVSRELIALAAAQPQPFADYSEGQYRAQIEAIADEVLSSGRHIVGWVEDGHIQLKEVYRFENGISRKNGHLCWNVDALAAEVINGMAACRAAGFAPATMGIDTWAVDFVLLDKAGQRIGDAVAYRDERTDGDRKRVV